MPKSRMPVFNHVAMSVAPDLLDAVGREELLSFYGEVFGWTEMPTLTRDCELLVLRAHSNEQFVFLAASDEPMRCPEGDHFGMSVAEPAELQATLERAVKYRNRDPRVDVEEVPVQDFGVLRLHSFYLRYRLPLKIEVQCFEWVRGANAESLPRPS